MHLVARGPVTDLEVERRPRGAVDQVMAVPVALRRPRAGIEPRQVDAEVREAELAAERPLAACDARRAERLRIPRAGALGDRRGIERGRCRHARTSSPALEDRLPLLLEGFCPLARILGHRRGNADLELLLEGLRRRTLEAR